MPVDPETLDDTKPLPYSYWMGAFAIKGSVTPRVFFDVLGFGLLSFLSVLLARFVAAKYSVSLAVGAGPFEAAGAVLGLLLVLRMNAGYERWWEARKLWGGIVNQSRNLTICVLSYGPKDEHWRVRFVRWAAAFPHVIRRSLRNESNLPEIERLIDKPTADRIAASVHMPGIVARELGAMLREAQESGMPPLAFYEAERQRGLIIDYLGGCERIRNTPLARASAINVRRFIFLFLATLPFALLSDLDAEPDTFFVFQYDSNPRMWIVPIFVMLMAYPLLALDRIGMELQNPFDTRRLDFLPLDKICLTIESNLLELLNDDTIASELAPPIDIVEAPPDASFREDIGPMQTDIS